ncbi:MAG TPA: thymidine phosphorylase [Fimbriimonadales bacterium]|nr:thymidine phosphorylase [Fimbriimonadales bacterium]
MTVIHFIEEKRDGREHSAESIETFIRDISEGKIPDYQIAAWLMAVYLRGLSVSEVVALTRAIAESGEKPDLSSLPRPILDKHSTGGVGDATTPIVLPILGACGITVVKMAGRGLGFTGGTIDKLEAIPGFRTDLTAERLVSQAREIRIALAEQSEKLVPADKKLYALRDATGTVDSLPLIASSVMSKKLACGADGIVLDVKVGSGAFMKTEDRARELAKLMVEIGRGAGKTVRAILTTMNQPLAKAVGNALEVKDAILELKNGCRGRLGRVALTLAKEAIEIAKSLGGHPKVNDPSEVVSNGAAVEKLREWIKAQGGVSEVVDNPDNVLPRAPIRRECKASSSGFIIEFATAEIGEIARELGAGRFRKEDEINPAVGLEVRKELGDEVHSGDLLFVIHASSNESADKAAAKLLSAVKIGDQQAEEKLIVDII